MTVSGAHRGRGVARRMVESLDELAVERGIEEFEVLVHPANRPAANLFRSMGFAMALDDGSVVGRRPVGIARPEGAELVLAA